MARPVPRPQQPERHRRDDARQLDAEIVVEPAVEERIDARRTGQSEHFQPEIHDAKQPARHDRPVEFDDQREDVPRQPERDEVCNDGKQQTGSPASSAPAPSRSRRRRRSRAGDRRSVAERALLADARRSTDSRRRRARIFRRYAVRRSVGRCRLVHRQAAAPDPIRRPNVTATRKRDPLAVGGLGVGSAGLRRNLLAAPVVDRGAVEAGRSTATKAGVYALVESGGDRQRQAELYDEHDETVDAPLRRRRPAFDAKGLVKFQHRIVDCV